MLGPGASPTAPAYPGYPPRSPYIRRISPPGSPAPTKSCCYELHHADAAQPYQQRHQQQQHAAPETFLCCCYAIPGRPSTSALATLGVCFLVLAYTTLGAFTFMALEGGVARPAAPAEGAPGGADLAGDLRSQTVDRLWSITENLNILYRENWTKLAAEEVLEFQEALFRALRGAKRGGAEGAHGDDAGFRPRQQRGHRWTFTSSFLYSLTLITTIGYGSVAPRTPWGKLVTIAYALVGIPLMLLYLSTTGDVLARAFRRLYARACGAARPKRRCRCSGTNVRVPAALCLAIVLAYVCSGAFLFHRLENWTILDGSYFCFTSLGTIGFGDLVPEDRLSLAACAAYILAGMAVVAMCFGLVQEEVAAVLRLIGAGCAASAGARRRRRGNGGAACDAGA